MSGDLIVDKVAATNVATRTALVKGLSKAWANLNGTGTIAFYDSFNIASAVDNGTGNYTINMTAAMSSVNYASLATVDGQDSDGGSSRRSQSGAGYYKLLSGLIVSGVYTFVDTVSFKSSIVGDLA